VRKQLRGYLLASWRLTFPILVIMGFDVLINLTDTLIAGLLGKQTQAAVGVANQTYFIFTFIINAVTVGTIAVVSRIFTSPQKKRISRLQYLQLSALPPPFP
jgi:Na+-driven multidrug efflux pump